MAESKCTDQDELTIVLDERMHIAEYIGSRRAIEAEGLIPPDAKWPARLDAFSYQAHGCYFSLRRERPKGAKGPRRDFYEVDNWRLRINPQGVDWISMEIERKAKDLADTIRRNTQEWRNESNLLWKRLCASREDSKFQAFKALIPGLVEPPRVRRVAPE